MRPALADIAIPPLPPDLTWIGGTPPRADRLAATGPVLVHFFDFAQLNAVRAIPYARAWHERYAQPGLAVLGVHTPRFPFTASDDAVADAVRGLGIAHPVAVDSARRVWRAYGCEGWPSLFLWGRGGVLRWFHFGEGEYEATEEAIQELVLESAPEARLPDPMTPLRPSDASGALVIPPSEELLPGGSATAPWRASADDPELELDYAAGGAYASVDGSGTIEVSLDGGTARRVKVDAPGLVELSAHASHEEHVMRMRPSEGVRVWSISFAAGVP
jgi:hypothetical protein